MSSSPSGSSASRSTPAPCLTAPSLRRRMMAWLYEGVLLFGVVMFFGLIFSTVTNTRHALNNRHAHQAFLFLVLGIYFVYFWIKGQTLAMKTWRIRVLDQHGRPLTFARALLRYMLSWIWFLPPLAIMAPFKLTLAEFTVLLVGWVMVWALLSRFHHQRQFWHDVWTGSRLVPADQPPTTARR